MSAILQEIKDIGLIPVVSIDDVEKAVPLAKALIAGGLPAAEITFRTPAAEQAIRRIHEAFPGMLLGAGTILTTEQADRAIAAGASFLVAPGLNPKVVKHAQQKGVLMLPGCSTPSDMEAALELGLTAVKFFPAEAAGGLPMLKAMAAPYRQLSFMPTGGITPENLTKYLSFKRVLACGGSFMVKEELIAAGDFAAITALTRKAVMAMLGISFYHLGVNSNSEAEAKAAATLMQTVLGLPMEQKGQAFFGPGFELLSMQGRGKHGHIGFSTHDLPRAIAYLKRLGVSLDEEHIIKNDKGDPCTIYLTDELLGFAVHLTQR